jgi:2'-5' RNA ligase superfamily
LAVPETALVIVVPEAEPLVAAHRLRHDPAAARGVPAHVTVLYPFRAATDEATTQELAELTRRIESFDAHFAAVGRFPGDVVYLAPEPVESFRHMVHVAMTTFPDCPPYGGTIPDPEPHLTVGDGLDPATADALAAAVEPGMPISMRVDQLTLLVLDEHGRWRINRSWPLLGAPSAI